VNYNSVRNKIKELFDNEAVAIRKISNTHYVLYKYFHVEKNDECWVIHKHSDKIAVFDTVLSAITWCLANHSRYFVIANNLLLADIRLRHKKEDIFYGNHTVKNTQLPMARREVAILQLSADIRAWQDLRYEIAEYIKTVKYRIIYNNKDIKYCRKC